MSRTETITCDVCGRVKAEVNHWWVMRLPPPDVAGELDTLILMPASEFWDRNREFVDLCGAECVHKKVDEFLGGGR